MSESEKLRLRWLEITDNVPESVQNKWWNIILDRYNEEIRHYHNVKHINTMFELYDEYVQYLRSPKSVAYAIIFHGIIYNPQSQGNEKKSVELFHQFADDARISKDSSLWVEVTELIELTITHSTDEHYTPDSYGTEDKHYFLDFDMSVLGASESEYDHYVNNIRQEYSHLPTEAYNLLRSKVLRSFLLIPIIFVTEAFRLKYESLARQNIQREIEVIDSEKH